MAVNVVRDKLINFEVFKDGDRKLGMADVTLPTITPKTSTLAGAGIGGDIEMPTLGQTESMELEISWRTLNVDITELAAMKAHDLVLRGAMQHYDAGTGEIVVQGVKIAVRGVIKGTELGTFQPADHTDSKTKLEVLYILMEIAGQKQIEVDKLNYIMYIHGTDYLADARKALGL